MKNSFVLYTDYMAQLSLLTMEQRGILLTAIMAYQMGQELPQMDAVTTMAYSFIRRKLDADNAKWEETCRKRSEAGKMGGRPRKNPEADVISEKQMKAKKANGFFEKQSFSEKAKKADNEYEYDNEYVNDNNKNIMSGKPAAPYAEIVEYLNQKTGKRFSAKAKDTQKHIKARWSEGWTLDDFKKVIDNMTAKWKGDAKMDDYLRPQTLFGTKFESYLNVNPSTKKRNSFNNFEGRKYDYAALERRIQGG